MMNLWRYIFLITNIFILTSCWDINEPDRMDYVYSIGIDFQNEQVVVHLQLVNLSSLGTPETISKTERDSVIATASAATISEAVHTIYQSAQQRIYLGHNTSIVLTEEALKQGKLKEAIDLANRFPETRYRMNVFVTKDNIIDLYKTSTIFQESPILTRETDLENIYEQSSRIKNISLREVIICLDEPNYEAVLPVIGVEKEVWKTEQEDLVMTKDVGLAIVSSDNMKGMLLEELSDGFRWMIESDRNNVTLYEGDKPVGELIVIRPKQKFSMKKIGDTVRFNLTISARATLNEVLQEISEERIIELTEEQIEQEVMRTYKKSLEFNADIYRLSEKVYRWDFKTWKKINDHGMIPLEEDSLVVKVKIDLIDSSIDKTKPTVK